jgi:surfeit locus 1 family protein
MNQRALIATIMTVIMLPVLIGLGIWQWHKKDWKLALLDRVAKADQMPPRDYAFDPKGEVFSFPDRVTVKGRFDHVKAQKVWVPTPEGKATRILTPLILSGSYQNNGCGQTPMIFVDRGIARSDAPPEANPPQGETVVTGRLLNPETSLFVSSGGANGLWTLIDVAAMGRQILPPEQDCVPNPDLNLVAPVYLEAETASAPDAPQPQRRVITLSNRHLEYALTWWSFAIALVIIFGLFIRSLKKKQSVLV